MRAGVVVGAGGVAAVFFLPLRVWLLLLGAAVLVSSVGAMAACASYHAEYSPSVNVCRQANDIAPAEAPGTCVPQTPVAQR